MYHLKIDITNVGYSVFPDRKAFKPFYYKNVLSWMKLHEPDYSYFVSFIKNVFNSFTFLYWRIEFVLVVHKRFVFYIALKHLYINP